MTRLSIRPELAAACLLLLASAPGAAQTAEHLANVHVVMTEGPVAHPDGTVYFTDLANDRILNWDGRAGHDVPPAGQPPQRPAARRRVPGCSPPNGATRSAARPAESRGPI